MPWLVGAFVMTVAVAAIYVGLQQLNRSSADDAGQRLASEVASAGAPAGGEARVDLARSLQPFFVIYDRAARAVAGDAYLDGRLAEVPSGVIATAFANGSDRVTWQPRPGIRLAVVAQRSGGRVILAGQSLRPVEARIDRVGAALLGGWGAALLVLIGGVTAQLWVGRRHPAVPHARIG
ncbi:hypothetical protein [Leifsonia poae]|uniref:hypothetical protein n=1 Tax=Leifsonia poae TaxID=110933 RepID=UPI001CC0BA31|nr:hypothetical protein [Leifsonia poae]